MSIDIPLAAMSITGLLVAFDAALAASEGLGGVYNQPRTRGDQIAMQWVDAEMARLSDLMQEIADEAERREPIMQVDTKLRAELLVRWGLECGSWVDILNAVHIATPRAA